MNAYRKFKFVADRNNPQAQLNLRLMNENGNVGFPLLGDLSNTAHSARGRNIDAQVSPLDIYGL